MTPVTLFLVLVAVAGVYAYARSLRLAPLLTEYPASTLLATLLAACLAVVLVGAAGTAGWTAPPTAVVVVAVVLGLVYVFGPVAMVALVRAGRWRLAAWLVKAAYRTESGRAAVGRLLAQAALQVGEPEAARELAGRSDPLLEAQALSLERAWDAVLQVPVVDDHAAGGREGGAVGNETLLAEARIEALIELGRLPDAASELAAMARRVEGDLARQTPLAFRSLTLSQARLAAAQGDVDGVRALLQQPLVGVRQATLYGVLARAADRAGATGTAIDLYSRALADARGRQRGFLEAEVVRLGGSVTKVAGSPRSRTPATLVLVAVLALAYLGQVLVDRAVGAVAVLGQAFDPSTLIAAYLHGLPGVPAAGAWWRYLSYAFLHGNLVHVGFNLWVLFDVGRIFERRRGWGDLMAAFTVGTAGGALLTSVMQAGQPLVLVGASGGVLGVAGALLAQVLPRRTRPDSALLRSLLQWMALIMLFSVLPGVSLWGHAGGVAGGFVYGLAFGYVPGRRLGALLGLASAAALALAIVTALTTIVPLLP